MIKRIRMKDPHTYQWLSMNDDTTSPRIGVPLKAAKPLNPTHYSIYL